MGFSVTDPEKVIREQQERIERQAEELRTYDAAVRKWKKQAKQLAHALNWVEHICPPSRHGCAACEALRSYEATRR